MPASQITFAQTPDGLRQLQRVWPAQGQARGTIVLVHGICEHSGRYERTGELFSRAEFDVHMVDLQGHGQTAGVRTYVSSFELFVNDVEAQLKRARRQHVPVILLGHSMGGLIAARYASTSRPQPDLLVLSAPALDTDFNPWLRWASPALSLVAPYFRMATPIQPGQLTADTEIEAAFFSDPLVLKTATVRLGSEMFRTMDVVKAGITSIRLPTYVLHGDADTIVPARFSEPIGKLPTVTRQVYPGLRHECFNEPEGPQVIQDTLDWINTQLRFINENS